MREDASKPTISSPSTSPLATYDEYITPNVYRSTIRKNPTTTTPNSNAPHYLMYFIPGNPGMISYYHTFLSSLSLKLSKANSSTTYSIIGTSLGGFYLPSHTTNHNKAAKHPRTLDSSHHHETPHRHNKPFTLRQQILNTTENIHLAIAEVSQTHPQNHQPTSIILIGHSVGAYMALSILHNNQNHHLPIPIKSCILLFPTISDILASPNAVRLSPLLFLPGIIHLIHFLVSILTILIPKRIFEYLVSFAVHDAGVETTSAFLRKSEGGVRQALYMARDEFREIGEDRWGVAERSEARLTSPAELFFYFAQNDDWVSNETRDVLIKKRTNHHQQKNTAPTMEIERKRTDVKHAFCVQGKEVCGYVAGKVAGWVVGGGGRDGG